MSDNTTNNVINYTPFSDIYESFYGKITDDMYMELTQEDTAAILQDLLLTAVHKFEFPRQPLDYQLNYHTLEDDEGNEYTVGAFRAQLIPEEINILATYMVVEWIGQQLASIENTRMKYSGSDFKFTSQANHMQKLLMLKKDYEREGFHLQRLYKRRIRDRHGIFHSTLSKIMEPEGTKWQVGDGWPVNEDGDDDDWIADGILWYPTDEEDEEW